MSWYNLPNNLNTSKNVYKDVLPSFDSLLTITISKEIPDYLYCVCSNYLDL